MIPVSLCVCLHLGVSSSRAFSLPQSRLCILWARQLCPLAVNRSCFGCLLSHLRTAAACLSRCIRHRRRSKAKPLRGSRGGYRRTPQNCLCVTTPSKCARTARTPKYLPQRGKYFTRAERVFHRAEGAISHGSNAAVFHRGALRRRAPPYPLV